MCVVFSLTLFYSTTDAIYHIPHTTSSCQHSLHVAHFAENGSVFLGVLTWRDGRCSSHTSSEVSTKNLINFPNSFATEFTAKSRLAFKDKDSLLLPTNTSAICELKILIKK